MNDCKDHPVYAFARRRESGRNRFGLFWRMCGERYLVQERFDRPDSTLKHSSVG